MSFHRLLAPALAAILGCSVSSGSSGSRQPASRPAVQAPASTTTNVPGRGVPLGGIGCGTFDILPDGRFSHATINNNWEQPIDSMPGCFAAVWTRAGTTSTAQVLSRAPAYGLRPSPALDFDGYWPRAVLKLADRSLPISVTLRAYSPLVPQDLKNSSIPAAVLLFTIKNEAHAPVEASIALSWENLLGVGGTASKGAFADRTGDTVEAISVTDGIFGVRMASPDQQLANPPHRLVYNARGTYAVLAAPTTPDAVVTTAGWNALDSVPGWWAGFARTGTAEGKVGAGVERSVHPGGVVAVKVSLKENEAQDIPFVIAWHTPRMYTLSGTEYGHYYEKSFADAVEVGHYVLNNRQSLLALLDEWQNRLLRSTQPDWLAHKLMNDSAVLATNTILTRDSGMAGADAGPFRFAMLEPAENGQVTLGAVERRYLVQALLLNLFPDLDDRELAEIMARQEPTGSLSPALGDLEHGFSPEETTAPTSSPAMTASFAYQVALRYRWTGDQRVLDRFYPAVKHALEQTIAHAGNADGVPEPAPGMAVASEPDRNRLFWLAACAIGRDLADAMADRAFSRTCSSWIDRAERAAAGLPSGAALIRSAAPAVWMAEELGVGTPTLSRLGQRLSEIACSSPRPDSAPAVTTSTTVDRAGSAGTDITRQDLADGEMTAAVVASQPGPSHVECSLTLLRGTETLIHRQPRPSIAQASSWNAVHALEGVRLDLPNGRLTLAPILLERVRSLSVPLFTPTFWAAFDYRITLTSARLTFRLDRMMPALPPRKAEEPRSATAVGSAATLVLREVVLPARPDRPTTEVTASVGRAPVPGKVAHRDDGRLVFTFATPLSLSVGQSLSFQLR